MRFTRIMLALAIFSLALPATAEEIIYFKNGQTLPIRTHRINDGMVRVDLGANSMMEFPEFTIDRIVVAGKNVLLERSYGIASNQRIPTTEGSFPVRGTRRPQDKPEIPMRGVQESATPVTTDPITGLAGYAPMGHRGAARQKMRINGNMRVFADNPTRKGTGETFTGTTQVGNRHVIGNVIPRRAKNPNYPDMVSITMKGSRKAGTDPDSKLPNAQPRPQCPSGPGIRVVLLVLLDRSDQGARLRRPRCGCPGGRVRSQQVLAQRAVP